MIIIESGVEIMNSGNKLTNAYYNHCIKYIILSTFNLVKSGDIKSAELIKLLYEIDTSVLFLTLSFG